MENTTLMILTNRYDPNSGQPVETLGDVLLYVRKKTLGWTRAELSKRTGIPANSISKYELAGREGGQYPPIPKLALLCAIMNIDVRVLLSYSVTENPVRSKILNSDMRAHEREEMYAYPDQDLIDQAAENCEDYASENVVAKYLDGSGSGVRYAIKYRFIDRYGQRQQRESIYYLLVDHDYSLTDEKISSWQHEQQEYEEEIFNSMQFLENNEPEEERLASSSSGSTTPKSKPTKGRKDNDI